MRRFLRFNFDSYYPDGGAEDLAGFVETLEDAKAIKWEGRYGGESGGGNILDLETGQVWLGTQECQDPSILTWDEEHDPKWSRAIRDGKAPGKPQQ